MMSVIIHNVDWQAATRLGKLAEVDVFVQLQSASEMRKRTATYSDYSQFPIYRLYVH
jgi:hypothetical protein